MNKLLCALLLAGALLLGLKARSETVNLTTANTVTLRGVIDDSSVSTTIQKVVEQVNNRGGAAYPIYLVLDSPGGSIDAGESFIQFIKVTPNIKTITIFAASMAAAIVEGNPGERLITENGMLMFHRAKGSFEGQFSEGEVESRLAMAKQVVTSLETRNATRLGLELQPYRDRVKDEWWTMGQHAVDAKAADAQVDIVCSSALVAKTEDVTEEVMIFNVSMQFSGCPLIRGPLKTAQADGG